MKTWTRAAVDQCCGSCGRTITVGEPLLELTLTRYGNVLGKPIVKVRCALYVCAGEAVPEDLPPLETKQTPIIATTKIRTGPGALPLDFKALAAGGDE